MSRSKAREEDDVVLQTETKRNTLKRQRSSDDSDSGSSRDRSRSRTSRSSEDEDDFVRNVVLKEKLEVLERKIKEVEFETKMETTDMRKQIIMKLPSRYEYKNAKVTKSSALLTQTKVEGEPSAHGSDNEEVHTELTVKIASLHKRLQFLYEEQRSLIAKQELKNYEVDVKLTKLANGEPNDEE